MSEIDNMLLCPEEKNANLQIGDYIYQVIYDKVLFCIKRHKIINKKHINVWEEHQQIIDRWCKNYNNGIRTTFPSFNITFFPDYYIYYCENDIIGTFHHNCHYARIDCNYWGDDIKLFSSKNKAIQYIKKYIDNMIEKNEHIIKNCEKDLTYWNKKKKIYEKYV